MNDEIANPVWGWLSDPPKSWSDFSLCAENSRIIGLVH
jgi:hypothetical protein